MTFNILYIEDDDPSTIIHELSREFSVIHHDPKDFEGAIREIKKGIDLLLLDFRLSQNGAIYDAPTLAQTIRTENTQNHKKLPIVLISSEDNISRYYKDYTSQDLFDFAIPKKDLLQNVEKYSVRLKSLINAYADISIINENKNKSGGLLELLKCPDSIVGKFSPRVKDLLDSEKNTTNTYMASDFILNHIVKPSGILIGEDILLARLGISSGSEGWPELKDILDKFKYTGIFSESYDRWWFRSIDEWWRSISPERPSLKRLNSDERKHIVEGKTGISNLNVAQKIEHSKSNSFWTICAQNKMPLDPIDGFESNKTTEPWEDKEYYSLLGVSNLPSEEAITPLDRKRYREIDE